MNAKGGGQFDLNHPKETNIPLLVFHRYLMLHWNMS